MTRLLSAATWPEIEPRAVVLVPVGSVEQHGPHLPMDTDTTVADAVARGVAARVPRAWVAPPILYGASGEHQSFAGTSSIGTEVLHAVLVELTRSMRTWAGSVVFINGHGGNVTALNRAVRQLVAEGHQVAWAACKSEEVDLHAGRTETSLLLHLRPDDVHLDRAAAGDIRALNEILPALIAGGVAAVSANGVLGDPAGASAVEGELVLASMIDSVMSAVGELLS